MDSPKNYLDLRINNLWMNYLGKVYFLYFDFAKNCLLLIDLERTCFLDFAQVPLFDLYFAAGWAAENFAAWVEG